jgi:hypothetical protein
VTEALCGTSFSKGHLEAEGYIHPSPNATLVGARVFRITQKGMAWLETPWPEV